MLLDSAWAWKEGIPESQGRANFKNTQQPFLGRQDTMAKIYETVDATLAAYLNRT